MKLTHEKTVHLSHVLLAALQGAEDVVIEGVPNTVRNRLLMVLREELRRDEEIEERARRKISAQKRTIPDGSPEWEILFRKYYEEELVRLGVG
ncbi:MAG: DUF507 family protein [Acidobacteriota bacterium]